MEYVPAGSFQMKIMGTSESKTKNVSVQPLIPYLHRDSLSAKVTEPCQGEASGNTNSLYWRNFSVII
jgi:hypothetical protein